MLCFYWSAWIQTLSPTALYDRQRTVTVEWSGRGAQFSATTGESARPCGPGLSSQCPTTDPTVWWKKTWAQRDLGLNPSFFRQNFLVFETFSISVSLSATWGNNSITYGDIPFFNQLGANLPCARHCSRLWQ